MKSCDHIRSLLDDYADGLLTRAAAASVEDHAKACRACAAELEATSCIREEARALPERIEPPGDLWPGIQGRILRQTRSVVREPSGGPWRWLGYAAAAALVVAAAVAVAVLLRRPPAPSTPEAPRFPASQSPQLAALRAMEADYGRARAELRPLLEQRRDLLSPETRAVVDRNLALIDAALREIRDAVEKDPNNRELLELLKQTYGQEQDLMRRAAALPAGA
jgi:anti-sigma-K factor RskA